MADIYLVSEKQPVLECGYAVRENWRERVSRTYKSSSKVCHIKRFLSHLTMDRFFQLESKIPWSGPPTVARDKVGEFEKLFSVCEEEEHEEEEEKMYICINITPFIIHYSFVVFLLWNQILWRKLKKRLRKMILEMMGQVFLDMPNF